MANTTRTIRLDAGVKAAARARADQLGVTMGALIENDLRQFIAGRPMVVDDDSYVPTEWLEAPIAESHRDIGNGDYVTVPASGIGDYLNGLMGTSNR